MTYLTPLLAQLGSLNPLAPGQPVDRSTGLVFRDLMLILLVGAGLTLLLILWARHYVRSKQRRRKPHTHSSHSHQPSGQRPSGRRDDVRDEEDDGEDEGGEGRLGEPGRRRRRRRRRRQRDHRPRNPTLAQTGGLPPPKGPAASSPGP